MRLARPVAALTTLSVALLTACSAPSGPARPGEPGKADDTFVIGLSSEFENLSPVLGYAADGGSLIFDGLMSRAPDLSLKPSLAAEAPVTSADGKKVTFKLRDGVTFHDGRPLTSKDVVYTYTTVLDPKTSSPISGDYAAIDKVSAPDARTVEFTLTYPYAPLTQRTTLGIVPDGGIDPAKPVGTGPYTFIQWTPGDKIALAANEKYWGGAPAIKKVVVAFAPDDNVRSTRLAAGEFDATVLPPKAARRFEGQQGVTVYKQDSADYRGIMFPSKPKVTGDLAIRKAFSLAMDRQAMVDTILAGAGKPAFGPISPDISWHNKAITGNPAADLPQAQQVLDAAGWKQGAGGIREKDGVKASFTIMYPAGDSLRKELTLAAASDAKKAGIEVKAAGLDWDAIEPRMAQDALMMGYGSPYDLDYINYDLFHSAQAGKGFFNPGHYRNPKVDAALAKGRESGDPAVRKQAYDEFQQLIHDDAVWTYLAFLKHVYVVRGAYQGVQQSVDAHEHATGGLFRDIHTWKPAS
ncbi:ABC transporter substrate-binding protein [Nonomuraea typhae]|uniref:ABC transporter substrate-binding protein n=1 Tax=Nonomuraea typhae TaxID=2603600 RepID=UPI0012F75E56|nr:ABC transporter substrate-binding protein [Nonomuraea typhae]